MHIPDGFVSNEIAVATFVVSAGAVTLALRQAKRTLEERQVPLLGVTAAFIFAAQMLNFPVAGGTSGHFMGAMLAALLVGPLPAILIMALVLLIQCLVFADGGITALGANIFNMGVVGAGGGYLIFRALQMALPKNRAGFMAAAGIAAWISIELAASACALELAFSGTVPLDKALPAMALVHALIGIGEALITTAVLGVVLAARRDLIPSRLLPREATP
ncbi:MAG: cobalamin biosynthesis protein CbiM [Deltaproteobacteria bacterium RBG_13_61_14]|nr:MAG: cobalamin biosynthesis protein CbiM [Deltaproteobacteria bacterium RBG_13_61_14]